MPPKKAVTKSLKFEPKEMVFAKMSGYPQWPAFITPQELIPNSVLKVKKKGTDYCVMFIPDGDFYWVTDKSLELLTQEKLDKSLKDIPEDIKKQAKELKGKKRGKSSNIKEAIAAADGLDFETFIRAFNEDVEDEEEDDEEEEVEEDEEDVEEEIETKPVVNKSKSVKVESKKQPESKKPRKEVKKEVTKDNLEEDEPEIDISEGVRTTRNGKTRVSIPKKPVATRNGKNNKRKAPIDEEQEVEEIIKPSTKKQRTPSKPESDKKSDEDEPNHDENQDSSNITSKSNNSSKSTATTTSSEASKDEKSQQLWLCRVKLQRSLIQRNQPTTPKDTTNLKPPTADELSVARLILYRLGDFPVNTSLLKETKIHKVLKCILRDPALEYPDSFKLHERCEELLNKWDPIIQSLKIEKSGNNSSHHHNHNNNRGGGASSRSAMSPSNEESGKNTVIFKNGLTATMGNKKSSPINNNHGDDSEVSALEQSISEIEPKKSSSDEDLAGGEKRKLGDDARTPTSVES
ncbi:uncharacterized protein J8A68_000792 [[Candida] subhashii]|uniref:PWWP domain-containing protein n=1 Tax=[Candida] subhashii TaxID=561895 RepID=A0A8J5QJ09_9ASCO|nr:uncharacterized protein J8A68_000792 [[Candida] subhashii]KAG7665586.1 hypothetical protein J8A68_000792 [[Candida] subhashii]